MKRPTLANIQQKAAAVPQSTSKPANQVQQPRKTFAEKAREDAERKRQEQEERESPKGLINRRFWLNKGESRMVTILDDSFDGPQAFSRHEHNIQKEDGTFGRIEWCLMDLGEKCPLCASGKRKKGSLVAFLTVLDYRKWTDNEKVEHVYNRTQLPVNTELGQELLMLEQKCVERGRTLRGATILLQRGTDDYAPRQGMPIPFKLDENDAEEVTHYFMTEEEIAEVANNPEVWSKEQVDASGKVIRASRRIKKEGEDMQPFDYHAIYGEPDIEALKKEFGGGTSSNVPGTAAHARQQFEEADSDEIAGVNEAAAIVRDDVDYEENTVPQEEVKSAPKPALTRPVQRPVARPTAAPATPVATVANPAPARTRPTMNRPRPQMPTTAKDPFEN
ncbi:MAG: hypothetical protein ABW007_19490 [Chitinophagaceae bacterium]